MTNGDEQKSKTTSQLLSYLILKLYVGSDVPQFAEAPFPWFHRRIWDMFRGEFTLTAIQRPVLRRIIALSEIRYRDGGIHVRLELYIKSIHGDRGHV